jgi:ADP-heptose:LPS heptosyltransferase|tara:strand:+ start:863 stop:1885 length:1023 start_codon:yes stop_codon:yes gene_type:complete
MNQTEQFKHANYFATNIECDQLNTADSIANRVLLKIYGGIGDGLMCLPIIRKLSEIYQVDIVLRNPSNSDIGEWTEELIQHNPYINNTYTWKYWTTHLRELKIYKKVIVYNPFPYDQETFYAEPIHRIDFAADLMGVTDCKPHDMNIHLTYDENMWACNKLDGIKNPVIIQPTVLRDQWCNNQGKQIPLEIYPRLFKDFPELTFVGIGSTKGNNGDGIDLGEWDNYVSFLDKTTIRQAIALLKLSKFHIIHDSFLGHASAGYNKKGIVIFGCTSPQVYGYKNNYNLWYAPPCAPCRLQSEPTEWHENCCIKDGIPVEYDNLKRNIKKLITEELSGVLDLE